MTSTAQQRSGVPVGPAIKARLGKGEDIGIESNPADRPKGQVIDPSRAAAPVGWGFRAVRGNSAGEAAEPTP